MESEIWKEIPGFNKEYYASNNGEILAVSRKVRFGHTFRWTEEKTLAQRDNGHGYKTVRIYGKLFYVHRLVASAFIPNPNNLPQVNHKDENKSNNSAKNLEWCTVKYNVNYGTGKKRSYDSKYGSKYMVLNVDTGEIYQTPIEASRKTGIHNDGITKACSGAHKTAGGYRWRYLNNG